MVSSIYFILDYLDFMTWPTSYAGWLAAYYLDYMFITLSRVYLFCIFFIQFHVSKVVFFPSYRDDFFPFIYTNNYRFI
jgi:hypothetical protein